MSAIFIAVSVLPLIVAYWIGRATRIPILRWVFPCLVVGLPLTWAVFSYLVFKKDCSIIPKSVFASYPATKVDGFFNDTRLIYSEQKVRNGAFQYIEEPQNSSTIRRYFFDKKLTETPPIFSIKTEFVPIASRKSEYVVTNLTEERVAYWWKPPIYIHGIEVKEKNSGQLIAKATDLVFGGGILSTYMRVIGGDQDFGKISCGYASADVGAWRPSLASRPRFQQYLDADLNFLVKALNPSQQ